jgi:hypothetical protein
MKFMNDLSYLNYKKQNAKESKLTEALFNFENTTTTTNSQINLVTTTTPSLTSITTEATTLTTTTNFPETSTEKLTEEFLETTEFINYKELTTIMGQTSAFDTSLDTFMNEITLSSMDYDKNISKELNITEPYEKFESSMFDTIINSTTRSSSIQINTSLDYEDIYSNQTTSFDSYSFLNANNSNLDNSTNDPISYANFSFEENKNDSLEYEQTLDTNSSHYTQAFLTDKNDISSSFMREDENYTTYTQTTQEIEDDETKITNVPENSTLTEFFTQNSFETSSENLQSNFANQQSIATKQIKASTENSFSSLILFNTELHVLGNIRKLKSI